VVVTECDQRTDRGVQLYLRAGDALLCLRRQKKMVAIRNSFAPALFGVTLGLFGEAPEEKWLRTRREICSEILFLSLPFTELLRTSSTFTSR
jgi:hypothetical protein